MIAPGNFPAGETTVTFTAPPNTMLAADTPYAIVLGLVGAGRNIRTTQSDADNAGTSGWSIGNNHHFYSSSAMAWRFSGNARAAKIAIRGTAVSTATNTAPTVATVIPDQTAMAGAVFNYEFPSDTFADADAGDTLTYTATKSDDTALPLWLSFAAATRTFSGTPQAADVETLSVKVTASDGNGGSVSDTFDIVVSAAPVCAAPDFGTRRNIWTSTVDVEAISVLGSVVSYGFDSGTGAGSLADNTFSIGSNDYTVGGIADVVTDIFQFTLTSSLTSTEVAALKLHVCETGYDFADATHNSSTHLYQFAVDLDWSMESTRTLYLSLPANRPATGELAITGTAQVGQELTVDVTAVADADGIVSSAAIYQWFRIDGGTETAIPGARGNLLNLYTLRDDDAGKQLRVELTFTDQLGGEETLTSAAFPSGATVAANPAITIAADRPTATGKVDWIHYTLSREGDPAAELTVTVTFEGPEGNDWSLDPTGSAKREVTFTAGNATAEQSIIVDPGFRGIGFSWSATTSGTLTARLGAKTGYDTSDTDVVQVVVTIGPAWVFKLADDAYSFDEDGGAQNIEVVATAASADIPAPSLNSSDKSVLGFALVTVAGTATSSADFAGLSTARNFPSSGGCSADPNAGNALVCRLNVPFTPVDDAEAEPDESLTLNLQRAAGSSIAIHVQGPGPDRTVSTSTKEYPATIVDDDFGVTGVTVTSTPQQATDTYGAWEHIEISVSFNRPVTVTGAPTFAFDLGGTTTTATYQEGSGTGTLVFSYQVMPGDSDTSGIAWAANALALLTDTSGGMQAPTLTVPVESADSADHMVNGLQTASGAATVSTVTVTSTPLLMASGSTSADTYGVGETIEFTVTFSAAVTVTGDPEFAFSLSNPGQSGIADKLADYDPAASTATTLVFRYTVLATDVDTNGIWVGDHSRTLKLDADDRILTASDNSLPASLTHDEQGTKENHKVDGGRGTPVANNVPVFSSSTVPLDLAENTAADEDVGAAVTATDADAGDTLSYTLGGDDMASFGIVATSGQIQTISGVSYDHEAKDSYTVTVTASDGTDSAVATVTISLTDVDEPPDAPSAISVTAVADSSTSLTVSWTAPANDGKPAIESYDVQYRVSGATDWLDGPEVTGTTTTTTVSDLTADTEYEVQVRATNDEGDSDWSDPPGSGQTNIMLSTNAPSTAANKTVTTVQNTNYTFSTTDFGFVDADGDQLASVLIVSVPTAGRLVLDGATVMASQTVTRSEIVVGSGLEFEPADGASGTGYASFDFKVNDGTDDSVSAYTMTINVTIVTAPDAPTALTATASGQAWIELAWTAPAAAPSPATGSRSPPPAAVGPTSSPTPRAPPPPTSTRGSTPAPPATTASPPSTSWARRTPPAATTPPPGPMNNWSAISITAAIPITFILGARTS